MSRYDAAAHIAEELPQPSKYVPIAMVGSIAVNGFLGLVYCIVLLFSLGDLTELLATPTGFPFMQLFLNITKSHTAASIFTVIISLTALAANSAGLTSTSRTAWSFARDNAFPWSSFFSHLGTESQVPVKMCALLTVLQMLLGLIYVGNTTAFNAILAMAIIGMYTSYVIPIAYMLHYRWTSTQTAPLRFGYFRLGKLGWILNVISLAWGVLAIVFSTFPSSEPVTAQNMNYSIVVFGGWVISGYVYFLLCQRKTYKGPISIERL